MGPESPTCPQGLHHRLTCSAPSALDYIFQSILPAQSGLGPLLDPGNASFPDAWLRNPRKGP